MTRTMYRRNQATHREGKVLLGCLVALGAVLALAIVGTVITVMNWRNIISKGLTVGFEKMVEVVPIEQSERDQIDVHIGRLVQAYKDKDISFEELFEIFDTIAQSPAVPAGVVTSAVSLYIVPSALPDEEKIEAVTQLQRFAHGVFTEEIDTESIGDLLEPLRAEEGAKNAITIGLHYGPSGKQEFKIVVPNEVTVEQINEVLAIARAKADEAEIDETVPAIDLSDEVGKAVDKAIGKEPEEAP